MELVVLMTNDEKPHENAEKDKKQVKKMRGGKGRLEKTSYTAATH